ncbi:uncharacterized protein LOC115071103 [Nannospalax galili]|uniref:uncharacterized protein LOC115071103 n=1 Tax=Nannospalax galili TaxID=1026970 RepID=UPI00111C11E7|nr:uncharacterized protein LOC115071103 [Nannospalax galili]
MAQRPAWAEQPPTLLSKQRNSSCARVILFTALGSGCPSAFSCTSRASGTQLRCRYASSGWIPGKFNAGSQEHKHLQSANQETRMFSQSDE